MTPITIQETLISDGDRRTVPSLKCFLVYRTYGTRTVEVLVQITTGAMTHMSFSFSSIQIPEITTQHGRSLVACCSCSSPNRRDARHRDNGSASKSRCCRQWRCDARLRDGFERSGHHTYRPLPRVESRACDLCCGGRVGSERVIERS